MFTTSPKKLNRVQDFECTDLNLSNVIATRHVILANSAETLLK